MTFLDTMLIQKIYTNGQNTEMCEILGVRYDRTLNDVVKTQAIFFFSRQMRMRVNTHNIKYFAT